MLMAGNTGDQTLAGRRVLITGGARRIGAALAEAFHAAGAAVVIHYRGSRADAEALARRLDAQRPGATALLQGELLEALALPALVDRAAAAFGGLEILINNASSFYPTPLGQITERHWEELIGSNLKAPLFLTQAAVPWLQREGGLVLNMLDIHARRPLAAHPLYCAAKAGLAMLTYALARELGPGIRVNGIAPGSILWPEAGIDEADKQAALEQIPLRRTGRPEDIAACALYLAREGCYVNGQVIAVDGGRHLGF